MSIVCGTDFSAPASEAVRVAALLSARNGEPLRLIHVVDELGAELTMQTQPDSPLYEPLQLQLHEAAERARKLGAEVEEELVAGSAPAVLSAANAPHDEVSLVVTSSLGPHAPGRWLLGSVSERVARASQVPVLVVRASAPFESWLRDGRTLTVMVGVDAAGASDAALEWVRELRALGPCEVALIHIARSPGDRVLRSKVEGLGDVRCIVRQRFSRTARELTREAVELGVDLLVVGSHQRSGIERLRHRSVSGRVLQIASMSVASVPIGRTRGSRHARSAEA